MNTRRPHLQWGLELEPPSDDLVIDVHLGLRCGTAIHIRLEDRGLLSAEGVMREWSAVV